MRVIVKLSEKDMKVAIKEYLQKRGYKKVGSLSLSHDGFPDSPDPREQGISYSAQAECEEK